MTAALPVDHPLHRIANPRSVAFYGASNNISSMGTSQLKSLLDLGFPGPVYPVHPTEAEVLGLTAYTKAADLPTAPDLAVLVLPTRAVPQVLDECGARGIRRAVVVSGGFKELGAAGEALEEEVLAITRRHGIRFLGPNCLGVAAPHAKLNTTFLPYLGAPGFIGMASQSGSFVTQMFEYLQRLGLGYSSAFSVGNEADLDLVDGLEYLAADPETKVIALYVESLRRGRRFLEAAREISPHKPIVAFYVGGSEAGRRAGLSHTGALAGPDRLYDGVFRQAGVLRAPSIEALFDLCTVLGTCPRPRGNRVLIQTHSGGPGAAAADAASRAGLELPPIAEATREAMAPFSPSTGSLNNPVDITFTRNPLDYYEQIPDALLADTSTDALLAYLMMPTEHVERTVAASGVDADTAREQAAMYIRQLAKTVAEVAAAQDKPLIGFSFRAPTDAFQQACQELGLPMLPSPERAARALAGLVEYARMRERILTSS